LICSRSPSLPLTRYVECIWHYESGTPPRGRDQVLPDGRFHLMLNLEAGTGAVTGLRSHHVVVDRAQVSSVMGVVFRPGAARGFFAPPAVDFRDRAVRLDLVWDRASEVQLLDRLQDANTAETRLCIVEATLIERLQRFGKQHVSVDPVVHYALQAFGNAPGIRTVTDVSREVGWSRRWFTQVFAEAVGMTPKRYCRLLRFQNVVRQIASQESVNWAELALDGGYCDQAHLVHEFRAFSGFSPELFFVSDRPYPNHVRIA
jgi:AraC-like DNA-binding protein